MSDSCVPSGWKSRADTTRIHDENCGNAWCGSPERLLFTKKLDVENENVCTWLEMPSAMPNSIDFTFVCFSIWHWFHSAFGYSSFDMDDWAWLSSNSSKLDILTDFASNLSVFIKDFNFTSVQQEHYYFAMIVIVII